MRVGLASLQRAEDGIDRLTVVEVLTCLAFLIHVELRVSATRQDAYQHMATFPFTSAYVVKIRALAASNADGHTNILMS